MRANPHMYHVHMDWNELSKAVKLEIDQNKARLIGVASQDLSNVLNSILTGFSITQYRERDKLIEVLARAEPSERRSLDELASINVPTQSGKWIPLSQIATLSYGFEEGLIWRRNREPTITVQGDIVGNLQAPVVSGQIDPKLDAIRAKLPPGYRLEMGGATEESAKGQESVNAVMPIMLLTMVTLLMIHLHSMQKTILVLLTAPLGLIGVTLFLLVFRVPFGFVAMLGVIALSGMIMRNSIILVDQIDQDLKAGHSAWEAVIESTVRRFRPILLTAAAAILAMIPLSRSNFWGPMAIAIMGGLLVATRAVPCFSFRRLYAGDVVQDQEAVIRDMVIRWFGARATLAHRFDIPAEVSLHQRLTALARVRARRYRARSIGYGAVVRWSGSRGPGGHCICASAGHGGGLRDPATGRQRIRRGDCSRRCAGRCRALCVRSGGRRLFPAASRVGSAGRHGRCARDCAGAGDAQHVHRCGWQTQRGECPSSGALAAAIPGTPAGLVWLAQRYGRLPLSVSLAPAITLARDGFPVDGRYASAASAREALLKANAQAARIFLADGVAPKEGFKLRQPQLASTLEALATRGRDGFYAGDLAARMVAGVRASGGIWELDDLATYQVVEREPAHVRYRGALITCAALPSAGGVVLTESLQILGRFPVSSLPPVERDHLIVEALRRGYQDRARYLGDPAFVMPPARLTTMAYADQRAASISLSKATSSAELDVLYPLIPEGDNTTHFSIVDAEGNRAAATLSVNLPFGAGVVAGDTGVLLNDEMNDFAIAPGVPNAYGLVGNEANAVQPHKRPLSSMTPAFVEDERGILVLGTPGGSRIMSMVLLGILQYVDSATIDVDRIVSAPRFHHQYLPDRIEYEPNGFALEWIEALKAMGHTMQEGKRRWGNMQAVYVNRASGEARAASDPRGKAGLLF